MSMDHLREELKQWKAMYEQAKKQKTTKNIEKMDASEKMEEAEKQVELLEKDAKKKEKQAKDKQAAYKEELLKLQQRNDDMRDQVSRLQQSLQRSKEAYHKVQENLQVKSQLPPTNINFVKEAPENQNSNNPTDIFYTCHIMAGHPYVLKSGQALLTFEDEQVARSIISKGRYTVDMEGTSVNVKALEPQLERYVKFEMKMNISNKTIKVCDLPPVFPEETIKDKVELAFYKSAIGGGEIEAVEYDRSNNCAYVTYLESGVPQRVLKTGNHCIMADGVLHDVQVEPCIDVQLDKLQMFSGISGRSVLVTEIKDIGKDEDEVQDLLQIHFQRTSAGGGEVEAITFSQEDRKILIFQEDLNEA